MSESLSHKILQAEIDPPPEVWEAVTRALDTSEFATISAKLSGLDIPPPPGTWDRIESLLPAKTIYLQRRRNLIRTAVAALVAGIIALSGFYFLRNNKTENAFANKNEVDTQSTLRPATGIKQQNDNRSITDVTNKGNELQKEPSTNYTLALNTTKSRNSNKVVVKYASVDPSLLSQLAEGGDEPGGMYAHVPNMSQFLPEQEYYTVLAPNGQPVRISSKFSDAVSYFFNAASENEDPSWKARLEAWRNKLMNSPSYIPSGSNFMDILELSKMMREQ